MSKYMLPPKSKEICEGVCLTLHTRCYKIQNNSATLDTVHIKDILIWSKTLHPKNFPNVADFWYFPRITAHTSGIGKSYQGILGICYFLLAGSNCHTVFCWLPDDQGPSELYYKIKREHKIWQHPGASQFTLSLPCKCKLLLILLSDGAWQEIICQVSNCISVSTDCVNLFQ